MIVCVFACVYLCMYVVEGEGGGGGFRASNVLKSQVSCFANI